MQGPSLLSLWKKQGEYPGDKLVSGPAWQRRICGFPWMPAPERNEAAWVCVCACICMCTSETSEGVFKLCVRLEHSQVCLGM